MARRNPAKYGLKFQKLRLLDKPLGAFQNQERFFCGFIRRSYRRSRFSISSLNSGTPLKPCAKRFAAFNAGTFFGVHEKPD
ncbi:MAG: hypothetical protein KKB25_00860, partial [Nanoarchaeota archaeon]|nr:hypothetical protein [Nanoarchaeota archaeon]